MRRFWVSAIQSREDAPRSRLPPAAADQAPARLCTPRPPAAMPAAADGRIVRLQQRRRRWRGTQTAGGAGGAGGNAPSNCIDFNTGPADPARRVPTAETAARWSRRLPRQNRARPHRRGRRRGLLRRWRRRRRPACGTTQAGTARQRRRRIEPRAGRRHGDARRRAAACSARASVGSSSEWRSLRRSRSSGRSTAAATSRGPRSRPLRVRRRGRRGDREMRRHCRHRRQPRHGDDGRQALHRQPQPTGRWQHGDADCLLHGDGKSRALRWRDSRASVA